MTHIYPVDMQSDMELVATILGRKTVDTECLMLADLLVREGDLTSAKLRKPQLDRLEASVELGKRIRMRRSLDQPVISTFQEVIDMMEPRYIGVDKEVFYCLCLNTKNHLIRIFDVSTGSLNASIVHPRELYKQAIRCSAASIIIVHNHPSGDPTPSGADLSLTRRLARAGDIVGIELLDHIVMGGDGQHLSMRETNTMP